MMEVVVAVFESHRAAGAAINDLEAARIPSARARVFSDRERLGMVELRQPSLSPGELAIAVTVEERHAQVVMSILEMQQPAKMTESKLQAA